MSAGAGVRLQARVMRIALLVSAGLAAGAGLQLFFGAEQTDDYFAWTIQPPLTAAFLGAMYLGAIVLLVLAAREEVWASARVAFIATMCLVPLLFLVTLIHLERFHTDSDSLITLAGTWIFITTYGWLPVLLVAAFVVQVRAPGADPARLSPLPGWLRAILVVQAVALLALGIAYLAVPESLDSLWPWELTPLTGRAAGAWLMSVGAAAAAGVWENDLQRIRVPLAGYLALSVLSAVALARYSGTVDWGHPGAWAMLAVLASMLAAGVAGLRLEREQSRHRPTPREGGVSDPSQPREPARTERGQAG